MAVDRSSGSGERWREIVRVGLLLSALTLGILARGSAQTAIDPALTEAMRLFETALKQKDIEKALASFRFANANARANQEAEFRGIFSSAREVTFISDAPGLSADGQAAGALGTLTQISEPRGAVEQWSLRWDKTPAGWRITGKESFGGIDGLVHLTLQSPGYLAAGQTIELEDFTLKMIEGTFFLNTQEAGPTALVFVGRGQVRFKPRPATERGQMKIFAKSEILEDEVSRAFLRIHPADLYRTLKPGNFVEDPLSASRIARATDYFDRHKTDSFILDAAVPGAPWWLLPGLGDSTIAFDTRRFGVLTLSLSSFEDEGVTLFNRSTQRQISAYPRAAAVGQPTDEDSAFDVVNHDLSISLNPETFDLTGRDTVTIDVKGPVSSFRFHLDDDLQVRSVRSKEAGRHLFFRVRGQNSVLVYMGQLSDRIGRIHFTVDYIGRLPAGTVESEILRLDQDGPQEDMPFFIDPALIYSKRRAFYPQVGDEDYSTSTLKVSVPADWTVVSGGARSEVTEQTTRIVTHEQRQQGKYIGFLVSRLQSIAEETAEGLTFTAFAQSRVRRDALRSVAWLKSASAFYSSAFGPLPYSPLNLAIIEAPVPGGHSPPGFIIVQQRPPLMSGGLKDDPATFYDIPGFFLAHELAHQWWGHGVTPRTYRDRWIAEGFAQYAAALWSRESQGEETFNRVLRKMVTWTRRLTAAGPVDLGNRVGHIQNNAQAHRAVVYDKGALVLDMVRRLIGDEAFKRSLSRLQKEHRFAKVDSETVRRAFEAEASIDLDGLWEIFVRNTRIPSMHIEAVANGQEIVVDGYTGPLPVEVKIGEKRQSLIVNGRLLIPGASPSAKVVLDPDGVSMVDVTG
jgi:hypothetical protein